MTMDNTPKGEDRRKFKRLKINFIVYYQVNKPLEIRMKVGSNEVNALMLDLSEGGMAIVTNYDIPISTTLQVKFTLIDKYSHSDTRSRSMDITGEICNNVLYKQKERRIGISFTDIDSGDREAIVSFVKMAINR